MRATISSLLLLATAIACTSADSILIKGGTVVNADHAFKADVLIKDGLIEDVGPSLKAPAKTKVIDASGKYVMPGGIDPHVHLEAPMFGMISIDTFYSGQGAALAGGTTMEIDFAVPVDGDIMAGYKMYREKAAKSVMDYGFHMAITTWNDKVAADMVTLAKEEGINAFKFFLAYKGALAIPEDDMLHALRKCKELGALPMVHCENADLLVDAQTKTFEAGFTGPEGHYISRPAVIEDEGTARTLRIAEYLNVPVYIVHVMSGGAMKEIGLAKARGVRVIGEAIASGIAAVEGKIWDPDFKVASQYVMSPPIRNSEHQRQLKQGLAGGILEVLATDHCPFNSTQKANGLHDFRKIPNGVNGLEERLHMGWDTLVGSGLITPSAFVALVSTNVAKIFNIYPQKGHIAPGSDADVIVFDPSVKHTISASTHHSNIDTNIYEGREVQGKVVTTISQGKVVWDGSKLHLDEGAGRFLKLPLGGPLFEGLAEMDAGATADAFPYGQPGKPVQRDLSKHEPKDEL